MRGNWEHMQDKKIETKDLVTNQWFEKKTYTQKNEMHFMKHMGYCGTKDIYMDITMIMYGYIDCLSRF